MWSHSNGLIRYSTHYRLVFHLAPIFHLTLCTLIYHKIYSIDRKLPVPGCSSPRGEGLILSIWCNCRQASLGTSARCTVRKNRFSFIVKQTFEDRFVWEPERSLCGVNNSQTNWVPYKTAWWHFFVKYQYSFAQHIYRPRSWTLIVVTIVSH